MNAANNTLLHEYSYDAWGRMRNTANLTTYSPGSEPVLFVAGRGFTGHEHLPWFNLINMNGRLYDPLTAQFLSPDNYVQDPTFTQNYNRYIYCLNNPLKYVDPSGYKQLKSWEDFWEVINNLMDYGGSWNSETGYSDGRQGGSIEGYGVLSGSGFQGPGQPYMLPGFEVTAKAPQKNTPTTPIIDNNNDPFRFDKNDAQGQGGDPYQNGHGETIYTMDQFLSANKGLTRSEIINQRQDRSKTFLGSQPGGPNMRYVVNPHDGRVLDMRHMLVVGKQPAAVGNLLEVFQWSIGQASGMDPQDFYSNGVGYQFYMQYSGIQNLFYPSTFTDQMRNFFYSPRVIYNW